MEEIMACYHAGTMGCEGNDGYSTKAGPGRWNKRYVTVKQRAVR